VGRDDRSIRVLLMITRLELGGAQRVVLHTAEYLDRGEFSVGLVWGPGDRLDDEAKQIPDLDLFPVSSLVRPIAPIADFRAGRALRAAVREFKPHVVHTHSSKAGILGRFAARVERTPAVVHTVHGFGFTPMQPPPMRFALRQAERMLGRWTDHFITVSKSDRQRGSALGIFRPEQATVIRAGIDLARFRAVSQSDAVRERLGVPLDAPIVVQIGNFKPQKAPLDFVRMAASVWQRFPEVHFVMVGDGELREAAERLAVDLGIAGNTVFCGWWDDVPGLLAATRVSVLTSRHEGLPCSVVESLAAGVPVVATAVDGTVEVIRPGENGLLAPAGDVRALAEGVCRILSDPELRASMAAAAPENLGEFDRDHMVRKQEELYRWIGGRNR
jgi:glycosyltransferase involved in cell wall biosynthesis